MGAGPDGGRLRWGRGRRWTALNDGCSLTPQGGTLGADGPPPSGGRKAWCGKKEPPGLTVRGGDELEKYKNLAT